MEREQAEWGEGVHVLMGVGRCFPGKEDCNKKPLCKGPRAQGTSGQEGRWAPPGGHSKGLGPDVRTEGLVLSNEVRDDVCIQKRLSRSGWGAGRWDESGWQEESKQDMTEPEWDGAGTGKVPPRG